MKKLTSILLPTVLLLIATGAASATDGTITFTGSITDTTCEIVVNGGSADATVTLPTVSANALANVGDTAGTTPFTIALSNCSGTSLATASTWFEAGTYVDADTGRLLNSGDAANVDVQLLNSNLGVITAGGTSGSSQQNDVAVDISGGSGTLNYYAQYYATASVGAGSVTSSVNYSIVYE